MSEISKVGCGLMGAGIAEVCARAGLPVIVAEAGAAHPQGPLALADLIGLDTLEAVAKSLYRQIREPHSAPPPLLSRMVEAGLFGRKSGRGFFSYDPAPAT